MNRRRRAFRYRRRLPPAFWVGLLILGLIALRILRPIGPIPPPTVDSPGTYRVKRVVDGDTLLLENGARVRLIGVDTPETKHPHKPVEPLGLEAAEFVRRRVEGRLVTLRFDRDRLDRYHRVLAYVYLDGWFLNEALIRAGYSRAVTRFPYSAAMLRRFRLAEEQARQAQRGLWAQDRSKG